MNISTNRIPTERRSNHMASRILHLIVAKEIIKQIKIKDENRFKFGMILPDAYNGDIDKASSHMKIVICDGRKKTYDLTQFKREFAKEIYENDLYLGYYLHLLQDMIYR